MLRACDMFIIMNKNDKHCRIILRLLKNVNKTGILNTNKDLLGCFYK